MTRVGRSSPKVPPLTQGAAGLFGGLGWWNDIAPSFLLVLSTIKSETRSPFHLEIFPFRR
jgi:hypothetical protein